MNTFTHNDVEYDLKKAINIVKNIPVVYVKINDLKWILEFTDTYPERIETADINNPLLFIQDGDRIVTLDGAHRLKKSLDKKIKIIQGKFINDSELEKCSLKKEAYLKRVKTLAGI